MPRSRYAPYDEAGLAAALAGLPGWTGDLRRLTRTVQLDAGDDARLRAEVARVADRLDHHPVLEDLAGGGTRFVLWTHVTGAVTAADTELAAALSALLD